VAGPPLAESGPREPRCGSPLRGFPNLSTDPRASISARARRERDILEHAVHTVAKQAAKFDDLVDEAIAVGHGWSDPLVTHAKMLRLELPR
jgi:hypothetical protein